MEAENSNVSRAEEFKLQANEAFKAHKYSQAVDLYTQAIEVNSQNAVYWANRSFAHLKLENYGTAIQDASKAVEIDPKYSKGFYRRGAAYLAMGKFKEALKDFQQVKRICPNDPDAVKKLKECEKAVTKLKFEDAISVPESQRRSVADSIDFQSIGAGPRSSSVPNFALAARAIAFLAAMVVMVGRGGTIVVVTIVAVVLMILGAWWWCGCIGGIYTKSQVHDLGLSSRNHNKC